MNQEKLKFFALVFALLVVSASVFVGFEWASFGLIMKSVVLGMIIQMLANKLDGMFKAAKQ